ncbi:MAG TPA: methyltransferase domain-containing protein [candidate division Zixibacteria bacterium]|nr:methyltransferase domain-containing protein [candidate division Zixibacteria bacterium]
MKHKHGNEHGRTAETGHRHDHQGHAAHGPGHKTHFHDPEHAAEYHRRSAAGGIRAALTEKLVEMLALEGGETVLDLATGTGRAARSVAARLTSGTVVGVDQAMAMLQTGREEKIEAYHVVAGEAGRLPFKTGVFDRAFVTFALHHFGDPEQVAREVLRVLKNGGTFVVLDPVVKEAKDAVDVALEARINQVFRRTHGSDFRFHTASGIQRLLLKAGYRIVRGTVVSYPFDQEGMDGVPTGRHWLEAAEELEREAPALAQRMRESYFTWHSHGDHVHVKGSFSYALVCAQKPA